MKKSKLILVISILFITAVAVLPRVYSVRAGQTATTITVSTTADVLDGADGLCSLREAVYAANNNVPFGGVAGECPAGTDADTDIITLADGATYTLSIAGVDEDVTVSGDLDILDNTAVLDVQFTVTNNGNATIDADDIDRVLHIENASVELNKIILANGSTSSSSNKIGGGVFNNNGILTMNSGEIRSGNAVTGGGIYNYSSSSTGGKVTLNGTQVILNGAGVIGGIFSGGDNAAVMLDNAIVRANSTNSYGGGIGIEGGILVAKDSTINLNTAQTNGGGIYAAGAETTITITGSSIEANEAQGVDVDNGGGGIYLDDSYAIDHFIMQNTTVKNNTATRDGGGINAIGTSTIVIQNSNFLDNIAENGGGVNGAYIEVNGGTFTNNSATNNGGAVYGSTSFEVANTVFSQNTASGNGGAIYAQILTATNIRVENNEATQNGGGIYVTRNAPEISRSILSGNEAGENGGGLYVKARNSAFNDSHISQTAVTNNHAVNEGGGIWTGDSSGEDDDSRVFIDNSTISSNRADSSGGGFYIGATIAITATNTTIALNTPGQDIYKAGELILQNSIIYTPDTPNCNLIATPINSLGNNLTDDASCGGLTQPGDEVNVDVGLAPLADNGGNTLTHNLLADSPAIDSGNAAACAASPVNNVDQRGIPRPIGTACDKGAVERGSVVFLPVIVK